MRHRCGVYRCQNVVVVVVVVVVVAIGVVHVGENVCLHCFARSCGSCGNIPRQVLSQIDAQSVDITAGRRKERNENTVWCYLGSLRRLCCHADNATCTAFN